MHESTSYRSSLMLRVGPVGSWNLSGRPWRLLVVPGVNKWKTKADTFPSPGLFRTSPKKYILDLSKRMKTIVLSTSGSKSRKPSNQASWGWFWWLLEPRLESHGTILHQKTFCYRIIVHWVICSWILRLLLTEPAGDPRKNVSTQKCLHNNLSAAADTSHTLLLSAESVLHEV